VGLAWLVMNGKDCRSGKCLGGWNQSESGRRHRRHRNRTGRGAGATVPRQFGC